MPPVQIGTAALPNYQAEGYTVHQAPDGSGEARLTYKTSITTGGYFVVPTPLTAHPDYPSLLCYESELALEQGDIGVVTSIFRGVLADDPQDLAQYEFNLTAISQPIQTHPLFSQPTSAPPVTPSDLAKIQNAIDTNMIGGPTGLSTSAGYLLYNKLIRGQESFFGPSAQYKINYCSSSIPADYSKVGFIASPVFPSGFTPSYSTYQNWLFIGFSWRKAAGVVQITEEYQLSGIAGWDTDLYV